jgi:hypothetical protein
VQLPELDDDSPSSLARRAREVLFENGGWRDFRRVAVVESSAVVLPETARSRTPNAAPGQCRILTDEPQRIEIDVELARPGLLVLADLHDAGWQAKLQPHGVAESRPVAILRTNRVQRGVWLPAGRSRVTFTYAPRSFYLGAGISFFAWTFALIWVGWMNDTKQGGLGIKRSAVWRRFFDNRGGS